jgi:hypothetical protein
MRLSAVAPLQLATRSCDRELNCGLDSPRAGALRAFDCDRRIDRSMTQCQARGAHPLLLAFFLASFWRLAVRITASCTRRAATQSAAESRCVWRQTRVSGADAPCCRAIRCARAEAPQSCAKSLNDTVTRCADDGQFAVRMICGRAVSPLGMFFTTIVPVGGSEAGMNTSMPYWNAAVEK